jgi:hypothetical protein
VVNKRVPMLWGLALLVIPFIPAAQILVPVGESALHAREWSRRNERLA